jgi:hypothetical protein
MSSSTLRILAGSALALSSFAAVSGAEAGIIGSALSSFTHSSPTQTVQFGGANCYYADGWNGRGWYQCGNEWNDGFGWIGPFNLNSFGGSVGQRHHRHGVVVARPRAPNPVYRSPEMSQGPGARSVPGFHTFTSSPAPRRFGAAGVPASPNFHAGSATATPGFAGGGFHGGLGGGNFHHFHGVGVPHIGAPASSGFAGVGGFHPSGGLGGATGVHIGAPASPGFAGVGGFHPGGGLGGATGVHIGSPASPSFAGGFHGGGGFHGIGSAGGFASPGFAGAGFHGGGGAFQGGRAAFGQGGIGHR